MQRAGALLGSAPLVVSILVIVVTEVLRGRTCITWAGDVCHEWSPFPGVVPIAALLIAMGVAGAGVGGTWGRRLALLVSGCGLLIAALLTALLLWVNLRDDLELEGKTLVGLFALATIAAWRPSMPRWALAGIAVLAVVAVVPFAGTLAETERVKAGGRNPPMPVELPAPTPMLPTPSGSGASALP